jgi:hypothetical protein
VRAPGVRASSIATVAEAATSARQAISDGVASGGLTVDQAYAYRRSLRRAMAVLRALDTPQKETRRGELASQVEMLATLAGRGKLTVDRMPALFRQLDANREWFAASPPPSPLAQVNVPGDPLVYAYYPGSGLQIQPLFNWTKVNADWFAHDYEAMQALIDQLAAVVVPQSGGWLSWEYQFDYGGSRAPWLSGMAQGVAIQALARAWQATGDQNDLLLAQQALPGLARPVADGGLLVDLAGGGRWWPLYASQPGLRVLNGDLQTVISLYDYAAITGDMTAQSWATEGATAASTLLPRYDTGAWSLYDGVHEADLGYHDLMTRQLGQLAAKSGIAVYRTYADRFAAYRVTPPTVTSANTPPRTIFPSVPASSHALATLGASIDKISRIAVVVTDSTGRAIAAHPLGTIGRGAVDARWNGRSGGSAAPAGAYQLWLRATDLAGNVSPRVPVGTVNVALDTIPPVVRQLRVGRDRGQLRIRWHVTDNAASLATLVITVRGRRVTLFHVPLSGRQTLHVLVPRRPFRVYVSVRDESGNSVTVVRRAS